MKTCLSQERETLLKEACSLLASAQRQTPTDLLLAVEATGALIDDLRADIKRVPRSIRLDVECELGDIDDVLQEAALHGEPKRLRGVAKQLRALTKKFR